MPASPPRPPRLLIFSGAGLSAESGVPTFRGSDGLWEGHRIEEVCDFHTWKKNSSAVHRFYNARRALLTTVEPNAAHRRIAAWQAHGYDVRNQTANVDDLLERAGVEGVHHVHGHLTGMQCTACGHRWEIGYAEWDPETCRCPLTRCGSRKGVKPAVVFFNEEAAYRPLYRQLRELQPGDTVLVTGTSLAVVPIHSFLHPLPGVTRILNALSPEGILAKPDDVRLAFDHMLFMPASEAVLQVERLVPALQAIC